MRLFSKLKDYNSLLEEILDKKTFPSLAKSLLFSLITKLEISYRDYEIVKENSLTKDEFLKNILDVIKNYCDNIKTVEPDSINADILRKHDVDAVTNSKERSILCYPTEQAMLYSISDIEPKYFYIKNDFLYKSVLQEVLVDGYKQNNIEILKNFNGWSWDISSNYKVDYIYNLIYQNIFIIMGEKFLYDWRTDNQGSRDYLAELKRYIKAVTGNDNYYLSLCKLLYLLSKGKNKKQLKEVLEEKSNLYQEYLNKDDNFKKKNIKIINKLKIYYEVLNNKNSVYEEVIDLQKKFIAFISQKNNNISEKEQILSLIYNFRYYQNIKFSENQLIKENTDLISFLDNCSKMIITKACNEKILKIVSQDINDNFEILKYILDTKIINLEEIKVYVECENDELILTVYDKEIFEKQGKKVLNNSKDIIIKNKRKIKLFS